MCTHYLATRFHNTQRNTYTIFCIDPIDELKLIKLIIFKFNEVNGQ